MTTKLLIATLIFASFAHAYPSLMVEGHIQKQYGYREWSEDERKMLKIILDSRSYHGDYGNSGAKANHDFLINNKVLSAKITKEVFYTESLSTEASSRVAFKPAYYLRHAFTDKEIMQMVRDNLYKIDENKDKGHHAWNMGGMLKLVNYHGDSSDSDIIDFIEKRRGGQLEYEVNKAKKIIKKRTNKPQKNTRPEKPLPNPDKVEETRQQEKQLAEQEAKAEEKQTSFPWWVIGLVVLLAIVFMMAIGKSKR